MFEISNDIAEAIDVFRNLVTLVPIFFHIKKADEPP